MSWKFIAKLWTDRTTGCSQCGKIHTISHVSNIPSEKLKELKNMPCHLPIHPKDTKEGIEGYIGSLLWEKEGKKYCTDIYKYPMTIETYHYNISIGTKEEIEEEKQKEFCQCSACGKTISKEEFNLNDGYCSSCFESEMQESDSDIEAEEGN